MYELSLLDAANFAQTMACLLSIVSFVPQWRLLRRTKSSANISLQTWYLWLAGSSLAWTYALIQVIELGTGVALLISASITVLCVVLTLSLVLYLQPKQTKSQRVTRGRKAIRRPILEIEVLNIPWHPERAGNIRERNVYSRPKLKLV